MFALFALSLAVYKGDEEKTVTSHESRVLRICDFYVCSMNYIDNMQVILTKE
jgi:hypothetical protein